MKHCALRHKIGPTDGFWALSIATLWFVRIRKGSFHRLSFGGKMQHPWGPWSRDPQNYMVDWNAIIANSLVLAWFHFTQLIFVRKLLMSGPRWINLPKEKNTSRVAGCSKCWCNSPIPFQRCTVAKTNACDLKIRGFNQNLLFKGGSRYFQIPAVSFWRCFLCNHTSF